MIADEIFAEIEKRLGALDEQARKAVKLALELVEEKFHPTWQGENPTWNEWQRMNEEKRGRVMDELEQRNRKWLERVRKTLGAFWLLVIDGQVVRYGNSPKDFPSPDELEKLCQQWGKVPLWYEPNPLIEEGAFWQTTVYVGDAHDGFSKNLTLTLMVQQTCDSVSDPFCCPTMSCEQLFCLPCYCPAKGF